MVAIEVVDKLWSEYVGSHFMSWKDEVDILNRLQRGKKLGVQKLWALFFLSKYWREVRMAVLKRDGFMCVMCGSKVDLHVDHKRYPKTFGDENLDWLQTLCLVCHNAKTKKYDLLSSAKSSPVKTDVDDDMYVMIRRRMK